MEIKNGNVSQQTTKFDFCRQLDSLSLSLSPAAPAASPGGWSHHWQHHYQQLLLLAAAAVATMQQQHNDAVQPFLFALTENTAKNC